jgi:hypothetical protein
VATFGAVKYGARIKAKSGRVFTIRDHRAERAAMQDGVRRAARRKTPEMVVESAASAVPNP